MSTLGDVRLVFLGFNEEMVARNILELVKEAKDGKAIAVADWALVHKDESRQGQDRGRQVGRPGREAAAPLFGGGVGMVLAALVTRARSASARRSRAARRSAPSPPAIHDSGMKTKDIKAASDLMAEGRTGLVFADPGRRRRTAGTSSSR